MQNQVEKGQNDLRVTVHEDLKETNLHASDQEILNEEIRTAHLRRKCIR